MKCKVSGNKLIIHAESKEQCDIVSDWYYEADKEIMVDTSAFNSLFDAKLEYPYMFNVEER